MTAPVTQRLVWPRLTAWVAVYAVVLQAFLAAAILPQGAADNASRFVICTHDSGGAAPASDDTPSGKAGCELHCLLRSAEDATFAVAPKPVLTAIVEFTSAAIAWRIADDPVPELARYLRAPPRGPPLAA